MTHHRPTFKKGQLWRMRSGDLARVRRVGTTGDYPVTGVIERYDDPFEVNLDGRGRLSTDDDLLELVEDAPEADHA